MKGNLSVAAKKFNSGEKMSEEQFDELILSLPIDNDNIIKKDELDSEDKAVFDKLSETLRSRHKTECTAENIKNFYSKLITRNNVEKFNGKNELVTRNLKGDIVSVDTGAKSLSEAREDMELDKTCTIKGESGAQDSTGYVRKYKKKLYETYGTQTECYVWNSENKCMDYKWGYWIYSHKDN